MADPPWDHSDGTGLIETIGYGPTRRRRVGPALLSKPPYEAMTVSAICELPVRQLADDAAHLYLWVTNRYLRHAWDVAAAWGFDVVSVQTWCKAPIRRFGAFGSNTEFFVFARRGRLPTIGRTNTRWFTWPRRRGAPVRLGQTRNTMHSAKPEHFYDLVEQISPGPYVELFARRHRLGWDVWGDQSANTATNGRTALTTELIDVLNRVRTYEPPAS